MNPILHKHFRLFGIKLTQWIHETLDLEVPTFAGQLEGLIRVFPLRIPTNSAHSIIECHSGQSRAHLAISTERV